MRARLSMIVATGVLVAAGVGSSPSVASATCSLPSSTQTTIGTAFGTSGYTFTPCDVQVSTGTTITWTGLSIHTATSDVGVPERFDFSGTDGSHEFLTPGDFTFYCQIHHSMTGTIHVSGPDLDNAPTAVLSAPSSATAGPDVTLDGSASSDPDTGDTLLYRWDLDGDGTFERTTSSATTTASFATGGPHAIRLQVVDDHGKSSAAATATVNVQAPPPTGGGGGGGGGAGGGSQPFAGIKLAAAKVKVGGNRIAAIRVSCPAGTAGGCAGKLTLKDGSKRVASKAFRAATGRSVTVKLKLSAAEARKLRKRHRLKLKLNVASHDGAGQAARTRTVSLTLVRTR